MSATDVKYYWHQNFVEMFATYSMFLEENDYQGIISRRLGHYQEQDIKMEKKRIIYEFQGDDYYYIEDSEIYKKYLAFVNEILHNPEAEKQYYFVVINEIGTVNGTCFNGVIMNDTTMEVVEFSALIRPENL